MSRKLQRCFDSSCYRSGGHSMYRILDRSAPTLVGFCLAGMLVCCVSCNEQTPPTPTDTIPLSHVAVSPEVELDLAVANTDLEVGPSEVDTTEVAETTEGSEIGEPILRVSVRGAKSTAGVYFCALFDSKEKLEQRTDPVIHQKFPATESEITWEIESLPPGRYSIAAFHDANENGKVDRHALGYPTEAYGFSNNARGKFGPPAYEKIAFEVGSEPQELSIQLK